MRIRSLLLAVAAFAFLLPLNATLRAEQSWWDEAGCRDENGLPWNQVGYLVTDYFQGDTVTATVTITTEFTIDATSINCGIITRPGPSWILQYINESKTAIDRDVANQVGGAMGSTIGAMGASTVGSVIGAGIASYGSMASVEFGAYIGTVAAGPIGTLVGVGVGAL